MLTVRVPATSANLGPGFDVLGMALDLWNTFAVEVDGQAEEVSEGQGLFQRAVAEVAARLGVAPPRLSVRVAADVPSGRGLGSSATVIVAGVLAADRLLAARLPVADLFDLASNLEGHPDNAAPALFGGVTISWRRGGGRFGCHRLDPPAGLVAALAVPERTVATKRSRGLLPELVPLEDAVFNSARTALLVSALCQGRFELLQEATRDRLHQPYREPLLPGFREAVAAALSAGAYGAALSGSGPTVVAFTGEEAAEGVAQAMQAALAATGVPATARVVPLTPRGAEIDGD